MLLPLDKRNIIVYILSNRLHKLFFYTNLVLHIWVLVKIIVEGRGRVSLNL